MSTSLTVLTPDEAAQHDRYEQHMTDARLANGEAGRAQSVYWGSLWAIHADSEWKAKGYTSEEDWIRQELEPNDWAPSRASYKGVMTAIADWQACGATEVDVLQLLGRRKVATEGDIRDWFVPGSERVLRPEVRLMLAAKNETPLSALHRISQLPPGQARAAAGEVVDREYLMIEQGSLEILRRHGLPDAVRYIVQRSHTRKGILGRWRVTVLSEPLDVADTHEGRRWPADLLVWVLSKFGLNANG